MDRGGVLVNVKTDAGKITANIYGTGTGNMVEVAKAWLETMFRRARSLRRLATTEKWRAVTISAESMSTAKA